MKINLENVTIGAADGIHAGLALRAMLKSMQLCKFGDAILFSHKPAITSGAVRRVNIEGLNSRDDYSRFILKDLVGFIHTPFVLLVQWDGYVLEPAAWKSAFTEYDLVGAKWGWHKDGKTVGNGGFTLRSLKLLKAISDVRFPFIPNVPEDVQICRIYRDRLVEEFDIKFAPEAVADEFSYERSLPNAPTFGFHGLFNMWRYLDDDEMMEIVSQFNAHIFHSREFYELLLQYFLLRKFKPLQGLYARLKEHCRHDEIVSQLLKITDKPDLTQFLVNLCESLVSRRPDPARPDA